MDLSKDSEKYSIIVSKQTEEGFTDYAYIYTFYITRITSVNYQICSALRAGEDGFSFVDHFLFKSEEDPSVILEEKIIAWHPDNDHREFKAIV